MSCTSDAVIEKTIISAAPVKKSSRSLSHADRATARTPAMSAPKIACTISSGEAHPLEASEPRDDQRAADRAGARERHHVAVAVDVAVEDVAREDRQERQQRQPQERRQRREDVSATIAG